VRGRKPKPDILKDLHGSEEPRNPNEPIAEGDLVDDPAGCPAHFNDEQRMLWEEQIGNSPSGMLKRIDARMLEAFVMAVYMHRQAAMHVTREPTVTQGPQESQSPWLTIMNKQALVIKAYATELGFSPVSRTRINTQVVGEALGPAAARANAKDAPSQSIDAYLASTPRPSAVN